MGLQDNEICTSLNWMGQQQVARNLMELDGAAGGFTLHLIKFDWAAGG